jgi:aspartate aminotransferase
MAAVADMNDEIVVPEPFYANYAGFAALLGIRIAPVITRAENGFHLPPDGAIEAAVNPRTRAILLANPGNPTGTVYTPDEIERLGKIAERHDLYLISDEVYREFVYDGARFRSALSLPCAADRVIITDSISKRFSACGARIGFAISRNAAVCEALQRLCYARLCPPTVAQRVAIAGYRLAPSYFDPVIAEYQLRRDTLVAGLNAIPGVHTYKPEGAFYTIVTLPVEDADDFCRWLLTDFSHRGETVMMAPASGFYATAGLGKNEARIAYVLNVAALERSLETLSAALGVYPGTLRVG